VVIAIIALLLGALLPAFAAVKRNAKIAQTQSVFQGLSTGIESYRAEQSLGASLPPSTGDNTGGDRRMIAMPPPGEDPASPTTTPVKVAGAHLLVLALMGDGLGTAGFKNVQGSVEPGWWDDTHKVEASKGLYSIDPGTAKEKHARYGPYVDEKLRDRAKGLNELADKGKIIGPGDLSQIDFIKAKLPVFLDSWDSPILYYKASPASTRILPSGKNPGIYRQEDNGIITGTKDGTADPSPDEAGLDFGGGIDETFGAYHPIANAAGPDDSQNSNVQQFLDGTDVKYTFAKFIMDAKNKSRITPVQKDLYLLISAGPDARYGTADDVTNWTRETN